MESENQTKKVDPEQTNGVRQSRLTRSSKHPYDKIKQILVTRKRKTLPINEEEKNANVSS